MSLLNPAVFPERRPWGRWPLTLLALLAPAALAQTPGTPANLPAFTYLHAARPLPKATATERVVFTVETPQGRSTFTLKQLQALPAVTYQTWHPQLRRFHRYEGVPLRDLAQQGGFLGRDVRLYASNGFVSTIHAQDYLTSPIMLAYRADDKPIPVLEKGPLTVVLPPRPQRFATAAYSGAWVWFAERLTPVP